MSEMTLSGPRVGDGLGVDVGAGVAVGVAVALGGAVGVDVGLAVGVDVDRGVGVCVGLGVKVRVKVEVGVAVEVGVSVLVDVRARVGGGMLGSRRALAGGPQEISAEHKVTSSRIACHGGVVRSWNDLIYPARFLVPPPCHSDHPLALVVKCVKIIGTIERLDLKPRAG
jgi:hypothetical protein